jgi:hypothetical protein
MSNPQNKVWMKDGVVYSELHGIITLEDILDIEAQGAEIMKQHNINIAPYISIMNEAKSEDFHIKLSDFSKMISSRDSIKHTSGIWIVGADKVIRKKNELSDKLFFGGKIRYVDTLEQAETEVRKMVDSDIPILEQD